MAKEWAKWFYNGKKWLRFRDAYIEERIRIDGGVCEDCRENQGYILHHRIILTETNIHDDDIALNEDLVMYVCKECHDSYEGHGVGHKSKLLCVFDKDGQPISLRECDMSPLKKR